MLLSLALLLPFVGGALLPLLRLHDLKRRAIYVEAVVVLTSVLVWILLLGQRDTGLTLYHLTDQLALSFRVDGMGAVFAGLVSLLWPIASLYAFEYMQHEERPTSFFSFYTMTYAVTLAVAFSGNLFTLFIFYECLTLITLPLVIHKQNTASSNAGRRYLIYSISGAALAFLGLVCVIWFGQSTDFVLGGVLDPERIAGHEALLRGVFLLAFVGFGAKAAVCPLHAWLPAVSVAPTPVTALLHAVAVVNTGAFAVLRLVYYAFGTELLYGTPAQAIAMALSCATILYGSTMAVREQHFKRRLVYSTVSNLSYMLMGAALMTPAGMVGSLCHMVFHSVIKITLFYCSGAILVQTGATHVHQLRGYGRVMPLTCGAFILGSVALVGVPPLCGFVSKWNLLTAAADTGLIIGMVAIVTLIISAMLTAVYLFSVGMPMFFRPLEADQAALNGQNRDPGWMMIVPLMVLCIAMVALGMWSQPLVTFLRQTAAGLTL